MLFSSRIILKTKLASFICLICLSLFLVGCSNTDGDGGRLSSSTLPTTGDISENGLKLITYTLINSTQHTLSNLQLSFSGKTYGTLRVVGTLSQQDPNPCATMPANSTCSLTIQYVANGPQLSSPLAQNFVLNFGDGAANEVSRTVNITIYPNIYPFGAGATTHLYRLVSDYLGNVATPSYAESAQLSDLGQTYPVNTGATDLNLVINVLPLALFATDPPLAISGMSQGSNLPTYFLTQAIKLYECYGSAETAENCSFITFPNVNTLQNYRLISTGANQTYLSLNDTVYSISTQPFTATAIPFAGNINPGDEVTSLIFLPAALNHFLNLYAYVEDVNAGTGKSYVYTPGVSTQFTAFSHVNRRVIGTYTDSNYANSYIVTVPNQPGIYLMADPDAANLPTAIDTDYTFLRTKVYLSIGVEN